MFSVTLKLFVAAVVLAFSVTSTFAETNLIMFDEPGCPWCELWREEVGVIYDKTSEGKIAPLVVLNIYAPIPGQFSLESEPVFTPTFVLVEDGEEVGRIEGYPGESFFWGLLGRMLDKLETEGTKS